MVLMDPLTTIRAIHFAGCVLAAGAAAFSVLVSEPAWRRQTEVNKPIGVHDALVGRLIWFGLTTALVSAAVWLVLVAAEIGGGSWREALLDGTVYGFLTDTQFGFVFQLRLMLAVALATLLLLPVRRREGLVNVVRPTIAVTAAALLGSLAWTGHAGGASGGDASVHLFADILHLLAAGIWIGGLFPLAFLLARLSRVSDRQAMAACAQMLSRFSNVGVATVTVLFASGVVNTWFLTAHMRGLIGTEYGRLVQIKIALFLVMLCLAADNRLRLLPRIARPDEERTTGALQQLRRNVALEIAFGLAALYVVGVLGVTPPAGHIHGAQSACSAQGGPNCIASVK